jgi:hypothetical protein
MLHNCVRLRGKVNGVVLLVLTFLGKKDVSLLDDLQRLVPNGTPSTLMLQQGVKF